MKVITAVLIGAGLRGGWVYAAYAQSHPEDLKIVAVAEPDEERRNLIAEVHGYRRNAAIRIIGSYWKRKKWQTVPLSVHRIPCILNR